MLQSRRLARILCVAAVLRAGAVHPAAAQRRGGGGHRSGGRSYSSRSYSSRSYRAPRSSRPVAVRSYRRSSGTVVRAHTRSYPGTARPRVMRARVSRPRVSTARAYRAPTPRVRASLAGTSGRDARGRIRRSESAKRTFMRQTGYPHGRPGYVIDHRVALACGGADAPSNMQWQTRDAAEVKDRTERAGCGSRRR